MNDRKTIRALARAHVKRHYVFLTIVCAVSIFLGTEFGGIPENAQTWYDLIRGRVTQLSMDSLWLDRKGFTDRLLTDIADENLIAGREETAERMRALSDATDAKAVLGRRRGALAAIVNNLSSGNMISMVAAGMHTIVRSEEAVKVMIVCAALGVYALVWIFLRNFYRALLRRMVLESRIYEKVPMNHFLYFKLVGRWARACLTLLLETVYGILWSLTLVGGVIKVYSYFAVPFIVAENPDIRPGEAITLSRRMMDGHKWECCKLQLSFAGWWLLGFVTFGAVEALWGVPYRMAAYSEYYAELRALAKEKGIPGAERLNDGALFAHAPEEELRRRYADIAMREDLIDNDIVELTGLRGFFVRNFGLWIGPWEDKHIYTRQRGLRHQAAVGRLEMSGRAYPERLNPLWTREAAALTGKVSYLTPCSVWSAILVFFLFSFAGWIWEVSLHLITHGVFVNRGVLHGPWLPIYGSGVTLIALLLFRFREKPALEAAAIVLLCGIVEYATSYAMEVANGVRWWDYTGYYLNLNGRICGEGLAVFAVGGMAAIYLLVPVLDAIASRASIRILAPLCLALLLCFGCDLVYSHISPNMGEGITELPATEMSKSFPAPEAGNGAAFAPNPNPETNPKIMKG